MTKVRNRTLAFLPTASRKEALIFLTQMTTYEETLKTFRSQAPTPPSSNQPTVLLLSARPAGRSVP
eukprot:scaffold7300_cov23-Tisochrysis_lutea.AAC.1